MSSASPVIDELERVLKAGPTEKRIEILRRVTDLFLDRAAKLTAEQTALFDDVISRLIDQIERRALAELSARLAPVANAPAQVMRRLAFDDEIEVAGPALARSERLTDQHLVEVAKSKGQSHLNKIAERARLSTTVTDALVDHGDRNIVNKVAANPGARFSKSGMSMMVMRADGDDELTETIGQRPDIPPSLFRQLLAHATEQARQQLLATARPGTRDFINRILMQVSDQIIGIVMTPKDQAAAQQLVYSLSQDTALTKSKLLEFADGNRIVEMVAALSVLSGLTTSLVGLLICNVDGFGAMVLCKATRLEWSIAHAVLSAGADDENSQRAAHLEQLCEDYERLSIASAQRLIGFWQTRQKVPLSTSVKAPVKKAV